MPPITDEHIDELGARRSRRGARSAPPAVSEGAAASAKSAGAARDLLRGLITDGTTRDVEDPAASDLNTNAAAPADLEREDREAAEAAPGAPRQGEAIDELIRRVKDSTAGATVEASNTLQQRRPKGTADLPRHATTSRAATRRRAPEAELRNARVTPASRKRRRAVAAVGLLGGIAVLSVMLTSAARPTLTRRIDSGTVSSRIAPARSGAIGGMLQAAIAAIAPELRAVARRAASSVRAGAAGHGAKRSHVRSRARHARSKHRAVLVQRASVTNSPPPSTASSHAQSSTAAPAPASTASQTPGTSKSSATTSSRPAGPTGASPLGGIGSCVKGC